MGDVTRGTVSASRQDRLGVATLAGILLVAGAVLMADNLGYLPALGSAMAWHWIMLGAGGLFLSAALVRTVSLDYRGSPAGDLILGAILVALGASAIFGIDIGEWWQWWPLILIVMGLSSLLKTFRR